MAIATAQALLILSLSVDWAKLISSCTASILPEPAITNPIEIPAASPLTDWLVPRTACSCW